MRPTRIQQNPISFIRKWPKAKRDLRGPSERIEVVTVSMTAGEIRDFKVPETLGAMLAAEAVEAMIAQATLPPARDTRREIALETALRLSVSGDTAEDLLGKADKIYEWLKGA